MLRVIEAFVKKSPERSNAFSSRAFPYSMMDLEKYLHDPVSSAPLVIFRVIFGLMMLASIIRFAAKGWIDKLYIQPDFHFSYYGFEWVQPLGQWTYLLFAICGLSALMVALGWKYRIAIITFFLSFTYIELMDKTTYLNHYYFISLMSFVLIFLPANVRFSVDAARNDYPPKQQVPRWTILAVQLLLGIVYFYAGLAKLNSDWLLHAMPLKIWLPSKYGIPILGDWLQKEWVAYAFAWGGTLYDLFIPFLLLHRRTRPLAFLAVVFFHAMTALLFPIGMFPWIMMLSTLIFADPSWHDRVLARLKKYIRLSVATQNFASLPTRNQKIPIILLLFFAIQILMPWRYLAYPGELFWTEEGFRFSWRVMLMEKSGATSVIVRDPNTGRQKEVDQDDYLTPFQKQQMRSQPDLILQFARKIGDDFTKNKGYSPQVFVKSRLSLNGRRSQQFTDDQLDVYGSSDATLNHWIIPLEKWGICLSRFRSIWDSYYCFQQ